MELTRKIRVTQEELYNRIMLSVAEDITKNTGKKILPNNIKKGFIYTKELYNNAKAKVEILDISYPSIYSIKVYTPIGENYISYNISKDSVTYIEKYEPKSMIYKLNYYLVGILYARRNKKRIKKLITDIEEYILENRD